MELTTFLAHVLIIHLSGNMSFDVLNNYHKHENNCSGIALVNSSRIKRDDGSYASDTGGPVASESEGDANGGTIDPLIQEALSKLDPCEAKLSPLFNKSSTVSVNWQRFLKIQQFSSKVLGLLKILCCKEKNFQ